MAASGGSSGGANSIRMGRAHVEIAAKDVGLSKTLDNIGKKLKSFGKVMAGAGAGLFGLGAGGLLGLGKMFTTTLSRMDTISKAADRLGSTTEIISALGYAAETSDSSLEGLEGAASHLQKSLADAVHEGGEAASAFEILGLKADDLLNLPLDEQFVAIADGLNNMESAADRTQLAMKILGKSGTEMFPLFKNGGAGIRALMAEAKSVGAVIGSEDADKAGRAGDAIARAWTSAKNVVLAVGGAFLPLVDRIEQVSEIIVKGTGQFRDFIAQNQSLVLGVTAGAAALMALGGVLLTVGLGITGGVLAIGGLVASLVAIKAAVLTVVAVLPTIGIVVAALALGLASIFGYAAKLGVVDAALEGIGQTWTMLKEVFGTGLEGIKSALAIGDFTSAFQIGIATLNVVWQKFVLALELGWAAFKDDFVDGWQKSITEIRVFWVELDYQIRTIFDKLGRWIDSTFSDILGNIARKLGSLIEAATSNRFFRDAMGYSANKALKNIGERLSATNDPTLFKSRQGELDAEVNASRQKLRDDLKNDLAERKVFRNDRIADQMKEVFKAIGIQTALVDAAKNKELATTGLNLAMLGLMSTLAQDKKNEIVESVSKSVGTKGSFSASQASQYGMIGSQPVFNKIELNTRNMVDKLDDVEMKLGELRDEYA